VLVYVRVEPYRYHANLFVREPIKSLLKTDSIGHTSKYFVAEESKKGSIYVDKKCQGAACHTEAHHLQHTNNTSNTTGTETKRDPSSDKTQHTTSDQIIRSGKTSQTLKIERKVA
jgi:hypothetical protein